MSLVVFVFIADLMVYLTWNTQALGPAVESVELCVMGQDGWILFSSSAQSPWQGGWRPYRRWQGSVQGMKDVTKTLCLPVVL